MSYANGTTHYNLPQTVGTDKRDWFDTNQAFADIDEALYGAVQQSTSTATAVTALTTRVGEVELDVATVKTNQAADEANIAALQTLTSQHTTQIADVKADALDMICAKDEGTAQVASVKVDEGEFFRYNDVLYIATADIAVGDTIIPNTNCRATNVATELESIQGGETISAEDVGYDNTTSGMSATNVQAAIDEVATAKQNTLSILTRDFVTASITGDQTLDLSPMFASSVGDVDLSTKTIVAIIPVGSTPATSWSDSICYSRACYTEAKTHTVHVQGTAQVFTMTYEILYCD